MTNAPLCGINPERAIGCVASGENGGTILQGNTEEPGLTFRRQPDFIADGGGQQVARRCTFAGRFGRRRGQADNAVARVFDRGDGPLGVARQVPPFIAGNAIAVCISAGRDDRMPGRGDQVRVVVIAIGKIRTMVQEQVESVSLEVGAISLQIILAKLIDDENHNQFGMRVICAGEGWNASRD